MRDLYLAVLAELRGSWRFRWLAAIAAWIVCGVGWLAVYAIPDTYESHAVIYVDTSSTLKPLLDSLTVDSDVLSRVELVTTAMLGRPQLEKVARQTNLHLRAKTQEDMDRLISAMRSRTSVGTPNSREPNLYEITYRDVEPRMAQNVVATLLNSFVEDSLGGNRQDTEMAQRFLRDELEELEAELVESEQRLAEFKRENVGQMPSEGGGYFDRLQSEMAALETVNSELRLAERRREALEQQLAGESPVVGSNGSITADIDAKISQNEERLSELQLRFTDLHPDVIAVKETLEQLRQQKKDALNSLQANGGTSTASDNPVYQNIQIELSNVNVEIAALRERRDTIQRKVTELRNLVDILPRVEAELARLTRDYDVKQSQYNSLLQRLEVAELSESADRSEDVKFRVIDPPLMPDEPVAPNRPMLLALVLLVGLGAGAGLAFLANQFRPVFNDVRSLRQATGMPVLGTIASLQTPFHRRRRAAEVSGFAVVMVTLVAAFVLVFLVQDVASQFVQSFI